MSNIASDAKACFSFKDEYRAVIRYLYLKGKTGKEIHGELADVYGSLFVLRFYGPVNPMGSCWARSVYLTTRLLGKLSPLSG